jgi:hypothetical protein
VISRPRSQGQLGHFQPMDAGVRRRGPTGRRAGRRKRAAATASVGRRVAADGDEAEDGEVVGSRWEEDVDVAEAAALEGLAVVGLELSVAAEGLDATPLVFAGDVRAEEAAWGVGHRAVEGRLGEDGLAADDADALGFALAGVLLFLLLDGGAKLGGEFLLAEVLAAGRSAEAEGARSGRELLSPKNARPRPCALVRLGRSRTSVLSWSWASRELAPGQCVTWVTRWLCTGLQSA